MEFKFNSSDEVKEAMKNEIALIKKNRQTNIENGCLEVKNNYGLSSSSSLFYLCLHAVEIGYLDCLKYYHENNCYWNKIVFGYAAKSGNLDCIIYLFDEKCPWDEWACEQAARNGHLECLQYLIEKGCPWNKQKLCEAAAYGGNVKCLQYVHEKGCHLNKMAYDNALKKGHSECVNYILKNICMNCFNTN
jgi:hypothetical protein